MPEALLVVGTRPEAIKLAPLYRLLERPRLCCTDQHRELLDPFLQEFDMRPDVRLEAGGAGSLA